MASVDAEHEAVQNASFESLKIDLWLSKQLKNMGVKKPTPVQCACIPPILNGSDSIGCAKTGSGKTLAFALPILQALSNDPYGVFALVVTPTRELAFQIGDQFQVLGRALNIRVCVVTGGMNMTKQGLELTEKPHIVIATPGRLADHMVNCGLAKVFARLRFLVLDEADRLLGGDFNEQMGTVLSSVPQAKRQTLLFSATMTDALMQLRSLSTNKEPPFYYDAGGEGSVATVAQLDQRYILVPKDFKDGYLVNMVHDYIKSNPDKSCIIFTDTCKGCQILSMMFQALGFDCCALHSMIRQQERLASLAKFKSSQIKILIATDVASRGLDIPAVDLIVNHNIPSTPKDYVHRVGRTCRAGRGGLAVSCVTPRDIGLLHAVEDLINKKLTEHKIDENEVLKILTQVVVAKRESEIRLDRSDFDEKRKIYKRKRLILQGIDPDEYEEEQKQRIRSKKQKNVKHKRNRQET